MFSASQLFSLLLVDLVVSLMVVCFRKIVPTIIFTGGYEFNLLVV